LLILLSELLADELATVDSLAYAVSPPLPEEAEVLLLCSPELLEACWTSSAGFARLERLEGLWPSSCMPCHCRGLRLCLLSRDADGDAGEEGEEGEAGELMPPWSASMSQPCREDGNSASSLLSLCEALSSWAFESGGTTFRPVGVRLPPAPTLGALLPEPVGFTEGSRLVARDPHGSLITRQLRRDTGPDGV
jgi:hypothetical protein